MRYMVNLKEQRNERHNHVLVGYDFRSEPYGLVNRIGVCEMNKLIFARCLISAVGIVAIVDLMENNSLFVVRQAKRLSIIVNGYMKYR